MEEIKMKLKKTDEDTNTIEIAIDNDVEVYLSSGMFTFESKSAFQEFCIKAMALCDTHNSMTKEV